MNKQRDRFDLIRLLCFITQRRHHDVIPDGLVVWYLPLEPMAFFTLSGAVLRHDLEGGAAPISEAYPHLICNNFQTDLGRHVGNILKCLFPVPNRPDTRRIITFSNDNDFISFRHHMYNKESKKDEVTLHDPRRVWKGPWRWYEESMLNCCMDMEEIKKTGITMGVFVCLFKCQGLAVDPTLASDSSRDEFRQAVRLACVKNMDDEAGEMQGEEISSRHTFLVVSYSRAALKQTGSGHFPLWLPMMRHRIPS
mmetsp:Transcript_23682/g.42721  ORF Transcript_23682/g.42721 Transcript_23682/m.42721 type:complete len:252 (-) Transcript_23682:842-1597(-)